VSQSVEGSLQEASVPLRRAVEILRQRPVDDVAAKALVPEIHELRGLMSTVAILMSSYDLPQFADVIRPRQNVGLARALQKADAELSAASDHLNQAASRLTTARQRLATVT